MGQKRRSCGLALLLVFGGCSAGPQITAGATQPVARPTPSPTVTPPLAPTQRPVVTPTPMVSGTNPPSSAQSVIVLSSAGATYALPAPDGVGGSITFASSDAPAGTTVMVTHAIDPNPRVSYQPETVSLRFSNAVTFTKFSPATLLALGSKFKPYGVMSGGYYDEIANAYVPGGSEAAVCNDMAYIAPGESPYTVVPTDTYVLTLNSDEVIPTPQASSVPTCPPK